MGGAREEAPRAPSAMPSAAPAAPRRGWRAVLLAPRGAVAEVPVLFEKAEVTEGAVGVSSSSSLKGGRE